jgi:hypothetical protein
MRSIKGIRKIWPLLATALAAALFVGCPKPSDSQPQDQPGAEAPAIPTGLSATALSSSSVRLAWTDNSADETGFDLERSLSGSSSWISAATLAANATGCDVAGLSPSTAYSFRLR